LDSTASIYTHADRFDTQELLAVAVDSELLEASIQHAGSLIRITGNSGIGISIQVCGFILEDSTSPVGSM